MIDLIEIKIDGKPSFHIQVNGDYVTVTCDGKIEVDIKKKSVRIFHYERETK